MTAVKGLLIGALILVSIIVLNSCGMKPAREVMRFGGWVTYWDFTNGIDTVSRAPVFLNDLYFFVVNLDKDGTPTIVNPSHPYGKVVSQIRSKGTAAWMTVVNDVRSPEGKTILKDSEIVHHLLSDESRRRKHRHHIVELAKRHGFNGIDIDYENLWAADRDLFTQFVRELAADARGAGLSLSVTVQPKARESSSNGPGAADWTALCESIDRLQIMLYNLHNQNTGPGPVATPEWISSIIRFAQTKCPSGKIVPILKISGMKWGPDSVEGVQYDQITTLVQGAQTSVLRDPKGNVPYLRYTLEGKDYTVYFEDAESILEKILVLKELNSEIIILWNFGRHDPSLLTRLKDVVKGEGNEP